MGVFMLISPGPLLERVSVFRSQCLQSRGICIYTMSYLKHRTENEKVSY